MNKILLCAAAFAAALLLPGAGPPAAAPKTAPDFPQQADLWINGGSPVKTDMGRERVADSFSGTILRKLDRLPETGEFRTVADRLPTVNHMLRLPGQPEPERLLVARMDIRMVAPVE